MNKNETFFQTNHRVFPPKGEFPVVVIDRDSRLPEPVPSIQWFGKAIHKEKELQLSQGHQFLFGLAIDLNAYQWHYYETEEAHESFRVAFLGKLKDWDPSSAIPGIAKALDALPEDYVALLSSGKVIVPETLGPSTFAAKVILLADDGGVIIVPREFKHLEVLQEEITESLGELSRRAEETCCEPD